MLCNKKFESLKNILMLFAEGTSKAFKFNRTLLYTTLTNLHSYASHSILFRRANKIWNTYVDTIYTQQIVIFIKAGLIGNAWFSFEEKLLFFFYICTYIHLWLYTCSSLQIYECKHVHAYVLMYWCVYVYVCVYKSSLQYSLLP